MSRLLQLPEELLQEIIQQLPQSTLIRTALVCRLLYHRAQAHLYENKIALRRKSAIPLLARTLSTAEDTTSLASAVKRVRFAYDCADDDNDDDGYGYRDFAPLLPLLPRVQTIIFQGPRGTGGGESTSMKQQEHRTAWVCCYEGWNVAYMADIFLHPSLTTVRLHGVCDRAFAAADDEGGCCILRRNFSPYRASTSLTELYLHNCHVSLATLEALMQLPRALKRLHFRRGNDISPGMEVWDAVDYSNALLLQAGSLEDLALENLSPRTEGPITTLANLTALKTVAINVKAAFGNLLKTEDDVNYSNPWKDKEIGWIRCGWIKAWEVFPPDIEDVRLTLDSHEAGQKVFAILFDMLQSRMMEGRMVALRRVTLAIENRHTDWPNVLVPEDLKGVSAKMGVEVSIEYFNDNQAAPEEI